MLDLGTGSGRLLPIVTSSTPHRVVGLDGSPALIRRARRRIEADARLRAAFADGRLELVTGDVRAFSRAERFSLILAVGVLPHLTGPQDAARMLLSARRHLTRAGRLVLDLPGPAALPDRDLPLDVDWERDTDGRRMRRRSRLMRRETPDGLMVALSTVTDVEQPDGTFAQLPASFHLWYPSGVQLEDLVLRAGLAVSLVYGSHDLDRFSRLSERLIMVAERAK